MAWKLCTITAGEIQHKGWFKRKDDHFLFTIVPFTTEISVGDTITLYNDEHTVVKITNNSNRSETLNVLTTRKVKENEKRINKGGKPSKRRGSN